MSFQSFTTHKKSRLGYLAAFLLAASVAACSDSPEETAPPKNDLKLVERTAKSAAPLSPEALQASVDRFLEKIRKRDGVQETASGLKYEVIEEGDGAMPVASSEVLVHYTGTLTDGTKFDSSRDRGEPISFGLNQVIRGWTEGLQLMREGSRYKLYIPSELGYGARGAPGAIPPNADLIFDVELIKVIGAGEPEGEPEPNPQVTAFLERGIAVPPCGDMPTPTGSESADDVAALKAKGNEWQNCMASFIKGEMTDIQTALGQLQRLEASQVPADQRVAVNSYLEKFAANMQSIEAQLAEFKGISKS